MTNELKNNVSAEAYANILAWLTESKYTQYKSELTAMIEAEKWDELEDSFFTIIEFGTGGRRGRTGIGSNRINAVTIGESAQALCSYASSVDAAAPQKGVVIACDTRVTSKDLSEYAAAVCAANGFKTYIFDSFRSTPELSFAVRHLKAAIGIVISASHNPPSDNGFKAYWSDGGQLVAPHDANVIATASALTHIDDMAFMTAVEEGLITVIGQEVDAAYIESVSAQAEGTARDLSIVYSPLHGAGQTNVLPVLRQVGFKNIHLVEDQMAPDGTFPTVEGLKPNPEEKVANHHAVELMMSRAADIAITNDPDADRIGVMVRHNNQPVYLNGNQSAVLAANYALLKLKQKGTLTNKHFLAKTIVTTDMLSALARFYGVTMYSDMLIGFKYIGRLLLEKENTDEIFVIGGEESYGLLKGTYARDKDGATGALPLAEYAAELKLEGKTLYDELLALYSVHGLYQETLDSVYFEGASGFHTMQTVMQSLRESAPTSIAGHSVTTVIDYAASTQTDMQTGAVTSVSCDKGNVIVLVFNGDYRRRITVRPSGTEPKIKLYIQWFEEARDDIEQQIVDTSESLSQLSEQLQAHLFDTV
jgi:phosphoglucomutase